jgi:hypothetical protein
MPRDAYAARISRLWRAAEGSRGAAAGFVKVRKTGIWHKHRRIAASEAQQPFATI